MVEHTDVRDGVSIKIPIGRQWESKTIKIAEIGVDGYLDLLESRKPKERKQYSI